MNVLAFYVTKMLYLLLTSLFFMLTTSTNLVAYDQITCDKLEAAQTNLDEQFGGKLKTSYNR